MTRRCKQCKKEIPTYSKSVCVFNKKGFCGFECMADWGLEKAIAKREEEERKKFRKAKEKLKSVYDYEREAQSAVNRYIRARDHGKSPIGSGKPWNEVVKEEGWKPGGAIDAGHFMSIGAKPQLRFHLLNIWAQSKSDNAGSGKFSRKSATVSEKYEEDLINRIGKERVEWLKNNNDKSKKELMCREDYIEYLKRIKVIFNKRARYYKKRRGII